MRNTTTRSARPRLVKIESFSEDDQDSYFYLDESDEYVSCHICNAIIENELSRAYDLGPNQAVCETCAAALDEEE